MCKRRLNINFILQVCYILILIVSTTFADELGFVFNPKQNQHNDPGRDNRGGVIGQGYNWLDEDEENGPEFEWIEISNIGTRLNAHDDWNSGPISLGWSFEFYDEEFDSIRICSNGWTSFTSNSVAYTPFELPTEHEPFNILAVQWVDLNPDAGGSIYFWTDPDEKIAIVSWIGISVWGIANSQQTFQMIIRGDNSIIFQYADNRPTGLLTCIGIQNGDGSDGLSISFSRDDAGGAGKAYGIGNPWIEYLDGAGIIINPEAVNFGDVWIDDSEYRALLIINHGGQTLTIDSISVDNTTFSIIDIEDGTEIESGENINFQLCFSPEETRRIDSDIIIYSNAENSDEGINLVHVTGSGIEQTSIDVEPREVISELFSQETSQHEINIANTGEEYLIYTTTLSAISIPSQGVPFNNNIETRYALFAESDPWGFNLEDIFRSIENLDYTRFSSAEPFDEVDLNDFDVVWIGNNQSDDWITNYNENLNKFEEFVDKGGVYYMCTASQNLGVVPIHPGGLTRRANYFENYGVTQLTPESNFLMGYMEWNRGTRLRGGSFCLTGYSENSLRNIENSSLYNILIRGESQNIPIVVNYRYGSGNCIVSGTTDGLMHDNPNLYPWGRTGEAMLRNMDFLFNLNQWISWSPRNAIVAPEQDTTLIITLEARNYLTGDYSAEIHIESNAINEPDIAITVDLHVVGVPYIEAVWDTELGYPDSVNWNNAYPDLLNDEDYEIELTLINRGSAILQIDEISISDDAFSVDEEGFDLPPNQEMELPVTFSPAGSDNYEAIMTIISDDPDESEFEIRLYASSFDPPHFEVNLESIEEELYAGGLKSNDLIITNSGGGQLRFRMDYNILEEPNRDDQVRNLRQAGRSHSPYRDEYHGKYAVFQDREAWGWYRDFMLHPINGLDYDSYTRSADIGNIDLRQYRSIIIAGNQQSAAFNIACRNNQAWFDEYVTNGGTMYIESGGAENYTFEAPGGIRWIYGRESHGRVVIGPEDNYLIKSLGWEVDHRLGGLFFLYSYYPEAQFQDLEDSEWYEIIVEGYNTGNPGVIVYDYGRGAVMVAGCPVGYQWHWNNNEGEWGSTQDELLDYLSSLSSPSWMDFQPRTGIISDDEEFPVIITLISRGQSAGDYEAELIFYTNDPEQPEIVIPVYLTIIGAPHIDVEWPQAAGYPLEFNWNHSFGNLFVDTTYIITTQVSNFGSDVLNVDEIAIDSDYFSIDQGAIELDPQEAIQLGICLEVPEEAYGNHSARITFHSNDPDDGEHIVDMAAMVYLQPIIEVDPSEITDDLYTGQLSEHVITIDNDGFANLRYSAHVEIVEAARDLCVRNLRSSKSNFTPERDDAAEVLNTFTWNRAPLNSQKAGITWDEINRWMWLSSYPSRWIGAVDPQNDYSEVIAWEVQNQTILGMAWVDGILYSINWLSSRLSMWDDEGNSLGTLELDVEPTALTGISNEDRLIVIDRNDLNNIIIYDTDGVSVGIIDNYREYIENNTSRSICWVPDHPDGQLWINTPGHIWQLSVDEETWEINGLTNDKNWDGSQAWDGIGHDGANLWLGALNLDNYLIVDDDVYELRWISVYPLAGSLEPDDAPQELIVTLNAARMPEGEYSAEIHIESNDVENPDAVVDVTMNVTGRALVSTEPIALPLEGAPEEIDILNAYLNDENGSRTSVIIFNDGSLDLEIERIESTNPNEFSLEIAEEDYTIPPLQEVEAELVFHPVTGGRRNGTIHFYSNAENDDIEDGHIWWNLTGTGFQPPSIAIDPEEDSWFELRMDIDEDPVEREIVVTNADGDFREDLEYNIYFASTGDPNRDSSNRQLRRVGKSLSPRRDLPHSHFALFADVSPWGYDLENIFSAVNGLSYDRYRNIDAFAEVDLCSYDAVWIGNGQSNEWISAYNQNIDRFEEFINQGGAYYMCSGSSNQGVSPIHPGGLTPRSNYNETWGVTIASGLDNYLIDRMGWMVSTRLRGNPFSRAGYDENDLNNIDNSDSYQVIVNGENDEIPVVAVYNYGQGWCIVSGTTDGLLHNDPNTYIWGQTGEAMLYYLDNLTNRNSWVIIEPMEGFIEAGEEETITLTISPEELEDNTDYYGDIRIETNDPTKPLVIIHMYLRTGQIEYYNNFLVTDQKHRITISEVNFENEPVSTDWEVGVFTPDGLLSGGEVWVDGRNNWYFFAYGDDPETDEQDGFRDGDRFIFRVWDNQNNAEYEAVYEIIDGAEDWEENGQTTLSISSSGAVEREIIFSAGWNIISLNIFPPQEMFAEGEGRGPDIILMTEQLRIDVNNHHIKSLKDKLGNFYDPAWGFNNIEFWNLEEGYLVKIDEDITATWSGITIPAQSDITMSEGWNIISYFPTYQLDASAPDFYVLSPIIDRVIIAKDEDGNFLVPEYNYSEMDPWRQTRGYMVCLNEDVVFNYPEEAEDNAGLKVHKITNPELLHWIQPVKTGANMSVLITSIEGLNVEEGSQLIALNYLNKPVGSGFVHNGKCGLAVWGDDPETEQIDGLVDGEAFDLRLWEIGKEFETELEVVSIELGDGLKYSDDNFVVLDMRTRFNIPSEFYLDSNYPNPFNATTRISYGLPEAARVLISVYDISGRHIETLVDEQKNPGNHSVVWNGSQYSSGLYLISMKASGYKKIREAILVK